MRLRAATAPLHAALETRLPLLAPSVQLADYRDYLALWWGFQAPLERSLHGIAALSQVLPDLAQRSKTAALEHDLHALGVHARSLPECRHLPRLTDLAQALGVLYVLEGSTLGGRQIQRHLSGRLPHAVMRDATRFLDCYGVRTGAMWCAFQRCAERAAPGQDEGTIVAAARSTFIMFGRWLARVPRARFEPMVHTR
jgi:heme oxygenase